MTAMRPMREDEPLMIAWNDYKATEDFANTKRWASHPEHLDGSLWACFMAGFLAMQSANTTGSDELVDRLSREIDAMELLDADCSLGANELRELRSAIATPGNQAQPLISGDTDPVIKGSDRVAVLELGDAGDAIDFALGHIEDPFERTDFLDAWREGAVSDWPEYACWLETQRKGAALSQPLGGEK